MEVFDEKTQECVLVVAPVLAIMCDNPRAPQIIGHMTGRPSKYAWYATYILIYMYVLIQLRYTLCHLG